MPRKEILETWAQVPLTAWLSSLCLEQEINLSADQGKRKGGCGPVGSEEEEKGWGQWLHCMGEGQPILSPNHHGFGQVLLALPLNWAWAGGSHQTGFLETSVQKRALHDQMKLENFPEEAILELILRGRVEIGGVWKVFYIRQRVQNKGSRQE